jgi:hypothetical protein
VSIAGTISRQTVCRRGSAVRFPEPRQRARSMLPALTGLRAVPILV